MDSYPAESDLVVGLDQGNELVRLCASGELSFADFSAQYGSLYWSAALDGRESDEIGLALLRKYSDRIALHPELAETVLTRVCSAADAERDEYRKSGGVWARRGISAAKGPSCRTSERGESTRSRGVPTPGSERVKFAAWTPDAKRRP